METSPTFGLKEAVDMLNAQTQRSDNLWTLYWVIAGAVIGFTYAQQIVLSNWTVRLGLTIGFLVFTVVNITALWRTQETLAHLVKGIHEVADDPAQVDKTYAVALKQILRATGAEMLRFHLFLDTGVVVTLWLPDLLRAMKFGKQ
jgi:hypothetical protein